MATDLTNYLMIKGVKKMKHLARIMLLLLILPVLLAPMAGLAQEAAQGEGALVVGSTTALTGEFYLSLWGNNTSDVDIRSLTQGYRTIIGQKTGDRQPNPLSVADMDISREEGNKVYTFTLQPDMVFSDGAAISAKDYVLTLMLTYHPLMREIGATVEPLTQIAGGKSYQARQTQALEGVHLIDARTFSIALDGSALPDYNELRYVDLFPSPLHVLLPGVDIVDDGEGVAFSRELSVEDLEAVMTGEMNYRSHPTVCSGPYVLQSYDEAQLIANLVRNEKYTGPKPSIERIRFVSIANGEMADALKSGRIHLANKVSSAQVLQDLAMTPGLNRQRYPRQGMAYLAFAFERDTVRNPAVRKAVAHCVDREKIIAEFLGGNGHIVNGYYGMGQWMARTYTADNKKKIEGYDFDPEEAAKLLKEAGYSEENPLKLTLLVSEGNVAAEALAEQLSATLEPLDAELIVIREPWQNVLHQYYNQTGRTYDMVFMASNFSPYFEPSLQFATEKECLGALNHIGILDGGLCKACKIMRATQPDQPKLYYERWIDFQQEFMNVLPLIPLYSNIYTDVSTDKLTGYDIAANMSWAEAIIDAQFE
jgi:peptide/nickel transport system substrate-binding protein